MKLDGRKRTALQSLLDGDSVTSAAAKAGVARQTLYSWLHDDAEFAGVYADMLQRRIIARAEAGEEDRQLALDVLRAVAVDVDASSVSRLKAAEMLLSASDKADGEARALAANAADPCGLLTELDTFREGAK